MKLSTKSRYASRLMIRLAMEEGTEPLQLNEIARQEKISEKYLSQIVIPLRRAGLIESVRGARGGYRLNKPLNDISLFDVVLAMEGGVDIVNCMVNGEKCQRTAQCATYQVWDDVSHAIEETLSSYTLEKLVGLASRNPDPMCSLLTKSLFHTLFTSS
ncbi:MAG: Rrf2 family transcriptional regulator [Spirochaetales bacterium]|nr:Rrf2 family transcriptional regulator [Spirochaetales bacterium]